MGGGVSNLFSGTKGSKEDYQFSIFPDNEIVARRRKGQQIGSGAGTGGATGRAQASRTMVISVEMVLRKCREYQEGKLSALELEHWLTTVSSSPRYVIQHDLRTTIRTALARFAECVDGSNSYDPDMCDRAVSELERNLYGLLDN